jgi:pimeloyl-ACP methyl ester carboxylesterase
MVLKFIVVGGHGDPIVLLHGWPETWYSWHLVMPALAKNYTVIAPDLPGLGDSSKPLTGYDGKTVAAIMHQLVNQLGFKSIFLVGHDIGTQVAYSYGCTSYRSKEADNDGINYSWFRTCW